MFLMHTHFLFNFEKLGPPFYFEWSCAAICQTQLSSWAPCLEDTPPAPSSAPPAHTSTPCAETWSPETHTQGGAVTSCKWHHMRKSIGPLHLTHTCSVFPRPMQWARRQPEPGDDFTFTMDSQQLSHMNCTPTHTQKTQKSQCVRSKLEN